MARRACVTCGRFNGRPRSQFCGECGRKAASAAYYARHKGLISKRRQMHPLSALERQQRNARAYLAVYVKRGDRRVPPALCATCRRAEEGLVPVQPHPHRPLEVVWFCRPHYAVYRRENALQEMEIGASRGGGYYIGVSSRSLSFDEAMARLSVLSQTQRDALIARAKVGPLGIGLDVQSPLYRMNVISLVKALSETPS